MTIRDQTLLQDPTIYQVVLGANKTDRNADKIQVDLPLLPISSRPCCHHSCEIPRVLIPQRARFRVLELGQTWLRKSLCPNRSGQLLMGESGKLNPLRQIYHLQVLAPFSVSAVWVGDGVQAYDEGSCDSQRLLPPSYQSRWCYWHLNHPLLHCWNVNRIVPWYRRRGMGIGKKNETLLHSSSPHEADRQAVRWHEPQQQVQALKEDNTLFNNGLRKQKVTYQVLFESLPWICYHFPPVRIPGISIPISPL
jgi:hypothetical protein